MTPADRRLPPPPSLPQTSRRSRWKGSQTTFGPLGRLVMTLLLLVPAWWFWEVQLFAWPGLVIWTMIVMPWALRDVWRHTRVRSD